MNLGSTQNAVKSTCLTSSPPFCGCLERNKSLNDSQWLEIAVKWNEKKNVRISYRITKVYNGFH